MRTLRVYYSAPVAETAVGCFPGAASPVCTVQRDRMWRYSVALLLVSLAGLVSGKRARATSLLNTCSI